MTTLMTEHVSGEALTLLIEKLERLETEKQEVAEHIRDTMQEAKSQGFEPRIMRQVLKLRKMDRRDRAEQEALLDLYLSALGMMPS